MTGSYRLSVTEVVDDYLDDEATEGSVDVGGSATGTVDFWGDRDWFAVTLEAGTSYRIDLEGASTGQGTLADPYLRSIRNARGDDLDGTFNDHGGEGRNSRVYFSPGADGTYYIVASGDGNELGTYTLSVAEGAQVEPPASVSEPAGEDFPADATTSGSVLVGESVRGRIDRNGDRDWFAVTLEAGTNYRIDLEGRDSRVGTMRNPELFGIYRPDGSLVSGRTGSNQGTQANDRAFYQPETSGEYYLCVSHGGPYDRPTGTYRLSVKEVEDDDYSAETDTAGTVEVGGRATGKIETPHDHDWFAVTLEGGTRYWIDLARGSPSSERLSIPYLRGVYDADGTLVEDTATVGIARGGAWGHYTARLAFVPETSGDYYIAAGGAYRYTGTYRLSVNEDDYSADTDTTGTVTVGGSATGNIEVSGESDWFAVTLEAGTRYRIDLEGSSTDAGTLRNPYLGGVYDADGDLIRRRTWDNDGGDGRNARIDFLPETSGEYYISANPHSWYTGTYRLSVSETEDDYSANTATTGTVEVGGSATGNVGFRGDRDWFAVTLEADKRYRFDLEGSPTGQGTLPDPYLLSIRDAHGAAQPGTSNDDGGEGTNSRVHFTPAEAGTYYVVASAYRDDTGTYTLSVAEDMI